MVMEPRVPRSARGTAATVDRPTSTREKPRRCKSNIDGPPAGATRARPARSKSSDGGGNLKRATTTDGSKSKRRGKKKGIRVAILIAKREEEEKKEDCPSADTGEIDPDEDLKIYDMHVNCAGKYHRKVTWPDVDKFWTDKEVDKDVMCDLLAQYSEDMYPERKNADNVRPKRCYLGDCKLRGISYYKDYDWDPVELHMRCPPKKTIEMLESWTKQVKLEDIPYTPELTNIDQVLIEQGDKTVMSTLRKSKLQGHPLALEMMTSETQIVTELRGLESVVGVLGNEDDTMLKEIDEETGDQIWRDAKTLRALLQDKPTPLKEGKGSQRVLEVIAYESLIRFRVHYKAFFDGDVVSDHGTGLLLGERWWAHPLKDIMSGYNQDNAAMIYEDIELRFFSEVGYKMDNEYFDWENVNGKWTKVKKTRE